MRPVSSSAQSVSLSGSAASWLGFILRLAAAAIWITAGASKLPDFWDFAAQLDRYQLLPHVLVAPLAFILPFLEIFLGLYLGAGLFVRSSALAGTCLFAILLGAQVEALIRGLSLDCGCFGTLLKTPVGPWTLIRDTALGIPTFIMLILPARRFSLDHRLFGATDCFSHNS
jgi:uncharacterized membrane protein YphA (DoxX/SURF4 family)